MLNTLLSDAAYRAWLIGMCDEMDLMWDRFTSVSEMADDISTARLERIVDRQYAGGISQAVLDSLPA